MGVEARILVQINNYSDWLSSDELRQKSALLTRTIGVEHFLINPQRNQHALLFDNIIPQITTNKLVSQVGASNEEEFQTIKVNVFGHYYGPTYARGEWMVLLSTMLWCLRNLPPCEVLYGGDSDGFDLEVMTKERFTKITSFYLENGHDSITPYHKSAIKCDFCGIGATPFNKSHNDLKFYGCHSCGGAWVIDRIGSNLQVAVFGDLPDDNKYDSLYQKHLKLENNIRSTKTRQLHNFDGVLRASYLPK